MYTIHTKSRRKRKRKGEVSNAQLVDALIDAPTLCQACRSTRGYIANKRKTNDWYGEEKIIKEMS
jgi:hypothetical protein